MSSVKSYQDSGVVVNYHPDEKVIHLKLKRGASPDQLRKIEDKLKTTLTIDSTDQESQASKILKLGQNTQEMGVHEFLQSILQGGQETGDAGDVGDEEVDASQVQPPLPAQPGVMPGGQPSMSPGMLPTESFGISDAYHMLAETAMKKMVKHAKKINDTKILADMLKSQSQIASLNEATYRTGDHWEVISRATGKGKQQIQHNDVLTLRRTYTKKKRSRGRDEVLRALDRVARYFVRKLRNTTGEDSARMFKERYKKIGALTPMDYGENTTDLDSQIDGDQGMEPEMDPQQVDFSEFFPKDDEEELNGDEEEYPDDEEDVDDPAEEYSEAPEEEYPD